MDVQNNNLETPTPALSVPSTPTPPTQAPAPPTAKKGSTGKVLGFLFVVLLLMAAAYGGYHFSESKAKKEALAFNSQIAALQSTTHELPADAVKLSECIPNMGSHYLPKGADQQYGPFLLVNKSGKVIGAEFMASADMYTPIPGVVPAVSVLMKDSPLYGWKYDHAELSHTPQGHEGFNKDHIDFHVYSVTPDEQKQACI